MYNTLFRSLREMLAQMLRSTLAARRFPNVYFGHNAAIAPDCHFGNHVKVYANARLANSIVGDYSYIGGGSQLQNVTIGKFCSVGPEVRIGLGLHPAHYISTYPGFYSTQASGSMPFTGSTRLAEHESIDIGHDVWIGARALILDGVQVGHGAIIGAGAIVTHNVPPYAIMAGVPARHLRDRFDPEMVAFLLDFAWWNRDAAFLREQAHLFANPETFRHRFQT